MARPENLKGVLFDFDGTLADTEILGFELDQAVAAQYGIRLDEQDLRSLIGTTGLESVPAMFARHGVEITYPEFEARRQRNDVIYKERLQGLVPGAKRFWTTWLPTAFVLLLFLRLIHMRLCMPAIALA